MANNRAKLKKTATAAAVAFLAGALAAAPILPNFIRASRTAALPTAAAEPVVKDVSDKMGIDTEQFFDPNVVQPLPEGLDESREISVVVETADTALLSAYEKQAGVSRYADVAAFSDSAAGRQIRSGISVSNGDAERKLKTAGVKFTVGATYDTLIGGFEVVCKAGEFADIQRALKDTGFTAYIAEEYAPCETQYVTNDVDVYDTGIFDSSDSAYDGTGTLVAVLDTGLDYTHSVFDPELFTVEDSKLALTMDTLAGEVGGLRAATYTAGLTAADVYVNKKVPFGYDYADKDTDVYPLDSEHGTHVSGVILGNNVGSSKNKAQDPAIVGVAPNAQLAAMKVFSDVQTGARWSWILAALEDCVNLDVDVINMSLGSSCGFTDEVEGTMRYSEVFDKITAHGISLVAAASNDYNSTFGSEKNGNLGLTSNPDSATIGSPGSYSAALAVASISGVKTPYLLYGDDIIYFTEASDAAAEKKNFVDDLFAALPAGTTESELDYVVVPGIGRSADYTGIDVKGKIALVRRGSTNFEDKARIAKQQGALGVIIYNNVSGDISMNVGFVDIAVCSISKDNGEMLREAGGGKIKIARSQVAGPFMSDFSSWGPTPDLRIKPEITAHGGDILSAVPGQAYDRLSGTSMASPNQAGVTALVRQYVKDVFGLTSGDAAVRRQVLGLVNCIMMSTTDIAKNRNGLPYSVRKQGAGLANLTKATTSPAYVNTYDRDTGEIMDKAKLEYGDDPARTGVYEFTFDIVNALGAGALTYDLDAIVMTEGVSETRTEKNDTTVTEEGYLLQGASVSVTNVVGGSRSENKVTIGKGETAKVTLRIQLSDSDKQYLESSFANGMYVEGYVTMKATDGTNVDLNVPYLAFYGDWTEAPLFDIDYFETNKDELDDGLDTLDKTLPDAYATRPIGGLDLDYISYLGAYYFIQPANTTKIAADRKYISLTNNTDGVNSINSIWAGMLRGAKRISVTITDDTTGEVIYHPEDIYNQRKSYNSGGSIRMSSFDIGFKVADYDLKNNTKYNVRIEAYLDYGEDGGAATNKRNVFEFPFMTDFEAPIVTGCDFYTEYDRSAQKNRLYARVNIYDNHYTMAYTAGFGKAAPLSSRYSFELDSFTSSITQVYSDFNTESSVTIELTDYISGMKESYNKNTFYIATYDYALNTGIYEIRVPDNISSIYFEQDEITLSPNQLYTLSPLVYPADSWAETLNYASSDESVVRVVGGKLLAIGQGTATVTASSETDATKRAQLTVHVLGEGDAGFVRYDPPEMESFRLTGYKTLKAFYMLASADRDIGTEGYETVLPANQGVSLSMFPSEQVQMSYSDVNDVSYFPNNTTVEFESDNDRIATVTKDGIITAVAEGYGSVSVHVRINGQPTLYDQTISITVKNPYERNGPYLLAYRGNGGKVEIPASLGLTEISQFAFSGYEYVEKGPGDVIDEEDPSLTKPWFIGEDSITEVVLPEGIEVIGAYAFAGLTSLRSVTLPSTVNKISQGAFYGCSSLLEVKGLENVKFINQNAFGGYKEYDEDGNFVADRYVPLQTVKLDSVIGIGNYAFRYTNITNLTLPESAQSIGAYAFADTKLVNVTIKADRVKLSSYAFANCNHLSGVNINAYVIPEGTFAGCTALSQVTIGKDVTTIGVNAFRDTAISKFAVNTANTVYAVGEDGGYLTSKDGSELKLVAPNYANTKFENTAVTKVADGAMSGNIKISEVSLPNVKEIGNYAFANTSKLRTVTFGQLEKLGESTFRGSAIRTLPAFSSTLSEIPAYCFYGCDLDEVTIGDGVAIGAYAFANCTNVTKVTLGKNVTVGAYAFYFPITGSSATSLQTLFLGVTMTGNAVRGTTRSKITTVTIGENANIGDYAFYGNMRLNSLSLQSGVIGAYAFYDCTALTSVDLAKFTKIGASAFSGDLIPIFVTWSGSTYLNGYLQDTQAPAFTEANLAGIEAEGLGNSAFANNTKLTTVTLSDTASRIPDAAFANCVSLAAISLSNVKYVGADAFYGTALTYADLSKAEYIGSEAFTDSDLARVTFNIEGFTLGDSAFNGSSALTTAENLDAGTYFGNYALADTKVAGKADLSKATYIGDFAFAGTAITEVTLSEALSDIGENPFAGCDIPKFGKTQNIYFPDEASGNVVGTETISTYDISEKVKVIDGAIYRTVPNGLELITYPKASEDEAYTVADDTVRVSARAFYGTHLKRVELPLSLKALGDKAFYGAEELFIVVFKSLNAPILEEQFDDEYYVMGNMIGAYFTDPNHKNLGLTPYLMWSFNEANVLYGATFQDYIGKTAGKLVMVRPKNGVGYGSFIYDQYFEATIEGAVAPDATTLAAIAAIAALPDNINLSCEQQVVAARAFYDMIATNEQRALVTNYNKLTNAEETIRYLKQNQQTEPVPAPEKKTNVLAIVLGVLGGVLGAAAIGVGVFFLVRLKKRKKGEATEAEAIEEQAAEDAPEAETPEAAAAQDAPEAETAVGADEAVEAGSPEAAEGAQIGGDDEDRGA